MDTIETIEFPASDQCFLIPEGNVRMYAITFDLDKNTLERLYHVPSITGAWKDIERILTEEGFSHPQGSVYMGDPKRIDAVKCVLAAQRLGRELPWFSHAVKDIRMFRIEDNNNLAPAIEQFRTLFNSN